MNSENYLNLDEKDKDTFIYRIICEKRFYEMFRKRQNTLVKPLLWDDPFENFILNSKLRIDHNTFAECGFRNSYYGQCWTLNKSSDAMWRIYSPYSNGLRIRTTIRKLLMSLSKTLGDHAPSRAYIGKVRYLSEPDLLDFGNQVFSNGLEDHQCAKTILVKRTAFRHEHEVRLIYSSEQNNPPKDIFGYSIAPNDLIDQVMIDPRTPPNQAKSKIAAIKSKIDYHGKIIQSRLYMPVKNLIFPVGP